ncbi:MAG: RNA methyltransferase [Rhodothermales bacterium]
MDSPDRIPNRASDPLVIGGKAYRAETVVRLLEPFLSDERKARIELVLAQRTRSVIPVIEGVHDLGNIGAVIRSAEGLGYQELHVIDRVEKYKRSRRTSQGAEKWIDLQRWPDAASCVKHLNARGYRIVVTCLEGGTPIDAFDFTRPTAIVFGNELEGVSRELLSIADDRLFIPMLGFAQSFNISVAAAVALYHVQRLRVERLGKQGDLSEEEIDALRAVYYSLSVQSASKVLRHLSAKRK